VALVGHESTYRHGIPHTGNLAVSGAFVVPAFHCGPLKRSRTMTTQDEIREQLAQAVAVLRPYSVTANADPDDVRAAITLALHCLERAQALASKRP
jgi:hypothetical protein